MKGLEPPRREAPDPKSGVATNYTTSALLSDSECKVKIKNQLYTTIFKKKRLIFSTKQEHHVLMNFRQDASLFHFYILYICKHHIKYEFMTKYIYLTFIIVATLFIAASCEKNQQSMKIDNEPVVSVLEQTLYRNEIDNIVPRNLSQEDSLAIADNFVRNWINDILLYQKAKKNIINKRHIEELVENYRKSLIIQSYEEDLVNDKVIKNKNLTEDKLQEFYNNNINLFLLKEPIIKGLYLKIPIASSQLSNFRKWYTLGTEKAIEDIDKNSLQNAIGYEYFLNKWLDINDIFSTIPKRIENYQQFLKTNKSIDIQDSSYVYLLYIKEYKLKGDVAPFEFAKDNVTQAVRERSRNNYISQIKKDLYEKALSNKEIKFYNK